MEKGGKTRSKLLQKTAGIAAGVLAACSVALAALVPSPAELLGNGDRAPGDDAETVAESEFRSSASGAPTRFDRFRARVRRLFLSRPSALRGAILLPFWALGKALLALFSALYAALSPVWRLLLGILLDALLLFMLFMGVYKLIFPSKRLRDFFTRRNVILLSGASVLLAAADAILRAYWQKYRPISIAVKLALGLGVLALLSWRVYGSRKPWVKRPDAG